MGRAGGSGPGPHWGRQMRSRAASWGSASLRSWREAAETGPRASWRSGPRGQWGLASTLGALASDPPEPGPIPPPADEFFHHPFLDASAAVKKCESPEGLGTPVPRLLPVGCQPHPGRLGTTSSSAPLQPVVPRGPQGQGVGSSSADLVRWDWRGEGGPLAQVPSRSPGSSGAGGRPEPAAVLGVGLTWAGWERAGLDGEHPMLTGADPRPLPAPPVPVPSYPSSGSGSSSSSSSTSHLASPPVSRVQGGGLRAPLASAPGCAGVRRNPTPARAFILRCRLVSSHQTQTRSACECGGVRSGWRPVSGSLCPVGLFSTVSAPRLRVHGRAGGPGRGPCVLGAHPPRSPRPRTGLG